MKFIKSFTCTEDERLSAIKNKVYKECFYLILALCCISIIIKSFILDWKFKTFAAESSIAIFACLYNAIRMVYLGIYSEEVEVYDKKHKTPTATMNVILGIILGIVMSLFFGIRNAILYGNSSNRIYYFLIVFFASLMIYGVFFAVLFTLSHSLANSISKKQSEKKQPKD